MTPVPAHRPTSRDEAVGLAASTGRQDLTELVGSTGQTFGPVTQRYVIASATTGLFGVGSFMETTARMAGGVVQISPNYACVPVVLDKDHEPVPVYYLVDIIDELLDYQDVQVEVPSLSLGQIAGAVKFLRRLCQFNDRGIDLDEAEEELLSHLGLLPEQLAFDVTEEAISRVLRPDH
jgi:hypothetical protein